MVSSPEAVLGKKPAMGSGTKRRINTRDNRLFKILGILLFLFTVPFVVYQHSVLTNHGDSSSSSSCETQLAAIQSGKLSPFKLKHPQRLEERRSMVRSGDDKVAVSHYEARESLIILPGELPGYTGWARPVYTLVDYYRLDSVSENRVSGRPVHVVVTCTHKECSHGGAWFYTRAYGPSLISALTTDHKNGTYTFTLYPHDRGMYHMEVVLSFSKTTNIDELPLDRLKGGEPSYEGYLLPGFPISFFVDRSPTNLNLNMYRPKVPCRAEHILQKHPRSNLQYARWLVTSKTRHNPYPAIPKSNITAYENISLTGYQDSENSVGLKMDYFPVACDVQPVSSLAEPETWFEAANSSKLDIKKNSKIHFVFFGDSNTRNQYNFFRDRIFKPLCTRDKKISDIMNISYVEVMKFWDATWPSSKANFEQLFRQFPRDHFIVVYNLGLHEFQNRCSLFGQAAKRVKSDAGPCLPYYQDDVSNMTSLVKSVPSLVKLWQSTTAGWHKWGVFGVAWPQKRGQHYPIDPVLCQHYNNVAWNIVKKYDMNVMDTFWLTLPRADHREVIDRDGSRTSYKLVHFGPEVYTLLIRQISMIALEAIKNAKPGEQYV